MSFARQQPIKREVIDLRVILADVVDRITGALPSINVRRQIADDLWVVLADRNLLEAAILNLAFNARDAMSGRGTLTISARNEPERGFAAITVADTGTGIAPDVLEHVFEPFFTTKEDGAGTGLGLSMVKDFAEQFGGTVKIDSEIGKGTSISIHLPRAETDPLAHPN
jgi:signal transduction histidine kinase